MAYLTAWELIAVQRMVVWEIPFMGTRFVLFRLLVSLPLPLLAGMIARSLAARFGGFDRMREKSVTMDFFSLLIWGVTLALGLIAFSRPGKLHVQGAEDCVELFL